MVGGSKRPVEPGTKRDQTTASLHRYADFAWREVLAARARIDALSPDARAVLLRPNASGNRLHRFTLVRTLWRAIGNLHTSKAER